jgi:hypothetical protein
VLEALFLPFDNLGTLHLRRIVCILRPPSLPVTYTHDSGAAGVVNSAQRFDMDCVSSALISQAAD